MAHAVLERTVTFHATHHYWHPQWSEERNRAVFGELAAPHGHLYRATVRVAGPLEPVTGFAVDLPALDAALEEILGPLRNADLNQAVPDFASGERLPSCENLARWIFGGLGAVLTPPARLLSVRVAESEDLAAEYPSS